MRITDNRITRAISKLARKMFEGGKGEVFLYGSRSRGTAHADSDWDLLVIIDDSISTDDNFLKFAFPFAELGWKLGAQITPIPYTRSQWQAEMNTSFHQNVIKDYLKL